MKKTLTLLTMALTPVFALAGQVVSSLEQYNYQMGGNTLKLRSYDAFDELSDFDNVTGLTVQVNGGAVENIAFDSFYGAYKRKHSWDTLDAMLAARPTDATIVQTLSGSPSGSVTIQSPGIDYQAAIPDSPAFTLSGVSGFWNQNAQGQGVFNFNPATVSSFTIRMNGYAAQVQGEYNSSFVSVSRMNGGYALIDEASAGLNPAGQPLPEYVLTFTRGLPLDAGDDNPLTFGYVPGTMLEIQGEFANIFGWSDAGLGDGSEKAFVYQNNTSLIIRAAALPVPEPASALLLLAGLGVVGQLQRRRQRAR